MNIENLIDKFLGRYFLAFVVATILLVTKVIDVETWKWICGFFFGGGAITSIANGIKKK